LFSYTDPTGNPTGREHRSRDLALRSLCYFSPPFINFSSTGTGRCHQEFNPVPASLHVVLVVDGAYIRAGPLHPIMQSGDDNSLADRRAARRYELSLPIRVWLTAVDSVSLNIGRTYDISTSGVYFILGRMISLGTALGFIVTLPAKLTGEADLFIRGAGKVSRVDEDRENDFGIAVVVERYEISRDTHSRI